MRLLLLCLLMISSRAIAQDLELTPELFADPVQVSLYRINFTYDVTADSVALEQLPRNALIVAAYAVIDTAIEQLDSARLLLRNSQGTLLSMAPAVEGAAIGAAEIITAQPMLPTGADGDRLSLKLFPGAAITGHLRLFVLWRRLY